MDKVTVGGTCSKCGKSDALFHAPGLCRDCVKAEGWPLCCPDCGYVPIYGTRLLEEGDTRGYVLCVNCGRTELADLDTAAIAAWNEV
jgi:ribosomal protein S14